ncbi:hypothetical protein HK101_008098 [Irineochytrium annulatum]|nr:hypothetical protein HK101_008098 [Irineochytrium annulatum]
MSSLDEDDLGAVWNYLPGNLPTPPHDSLDSALASLSSIPPIMNHSMGPDVSGQAGGYRYLYPGSLLDAIIGNGEGDGTSTDPHLAGSILAGTGSNNVRIIDSIGQSTPPPPPQSLDLSSGVPPVIESASLPIALQPHSFDFSFSFPPIYVLPTSSLTTTTGASDQPSFAAPQPSLDGLLLNHTIPDASLSAFFDTTPSTRCPLLPSLSTQDQFLMTLLAGMDDFGLPPACSTHDVNAWLGEMPPDPPAWVLAAPVAPAELCAGGVDNNEDDSEEVSQTALPSPQMKKRATGSNAAKVGSAATSTGPKMHHEVCCACSRCGAILATLFLFGSKKTLAEPYVLDVQCLSCLAATNAGSTVLNDGKRRRRKRTDEAGAEDDAGSAGDGPVKTEMTCQICVSTVGTGGVKLVGGQAPGFGVEVICFKCTSDYRFCSKCGGGGLWRSGRWRPKEMFSANRKTCSLPHLRIGDPAHFRFVTYRIPVHSAASPPITSLDARVFGRPLAGSGKIPYADMPLDKAVDALAKDVSRFWTVASLNTIADALTMQRAYMADNWQRICSTERSFVAQLGMLIRGRFHPEANEREWQGKSFLRYLAIGLVPNPNKGKKKRRRAGSESQFSDMRDEEEDYIIGGCSMVTWNVTDRHLFNRFSTMFGQYGVHEKSMLPWMMGACWERILKDLTQSPPMPFTIEAPLWSWGISVWGRGRERTRKSVLPDALRSGARLFDDDVARSVGVDGVATLMALCKDWVITDAELEQRDLFGSTFEVTRNFIETSFGRSFGVMAIPAREDTNG